MAQEKVTRQELRELHIGQTRIFILTDPKKVAAARVTCTQLKQEEKLEFMVKQDFDANAVSITRIK
jgi:hypothetical protein